MKIKPILRELQRDFPVGNGPNRFLIHPSGPLPVVYEDLASMICDRPLDTVFVLDSSFFPRHQIPECVLDALRHYRLVISPFVRDELKSLSQHQRYNASLLDEFLDPPRKHDTKVLVDDPNIWGWAGIEARSYYTTLLSFRKQRGFRLADDLQRSRKHNVSAENLNRLWNQSGAARDFHFLQKGFADFGKSNYFADEDTVVLAAMIAFITGSHTVILTRDGDLLDQSEMLFSRLVQHYQSLLFAERYAAEPHAFQTLGMPRDLFALDRFFVTEDSWLVRKPVDDPSDMMQLLLPKSYSLATFSCFLLSGPPDRMTLSSLIHIGEDGLSKLFQAKSESSGRSTTLLNGRDCHVWGFPHCVRNPREWVAVTRDLHVPLVHKTNLRISEIDLANTYAHQTVRTAGGPISLPWQSYG